MLRLVIAGLAGVFLLIGAGFSLFPQHGATLFGIPAADEAALAYVRAIGFRDLALAAYIAALLLWSDRRALGIVLGLTTLIPALDVVLVATQRGLDSPAHLALHGASGFVLAMLSALVLRGADWPASRTHSSRASAPP